MSTTLRFVRGLSAAALVLAMTAVTSPVAAASCKGASHQASLTNGVVTPGSGDTTTLFKFKVRYSDNASCVPASVTVNVSGVGDLAMEAVGGSATSYQRETQLPTGSFSYSFTAMSGEGVGYQVVTLSSVSPSKIKVSPPEPAPTASPKPTPAATPKPTTRPKPAATPAATPVPATPSLAPSVATLPPTAPPDSTHATPTPRPVAALGGGTPIRGAGTPALTADSSSLPWLVAWIVATAGGLILFVVLGRPPELAFVAAAADSRQTENPPPVQDDSPTARRARRQLGDESQLPRWLRPSVQAARYAAPGRSSPDD